MTDANALTPQPAAPAQAVEYPPLPKTDRIGRVFDGKFIVGNCHLYEIHQMRAYVDADRAARGAALAAPAQAVACGHLFELWWAEYMPEAVQAQAWKAWRAAQEGKR